jgi:hypothetical protein
MDLKTPNHSTILSTPTTKSKLNQVKNKNQNKTIFVATIPTSNNPSTLSTYTSIENFDEEKNRRH